MVIKNLLLLILFGFMIFGCGSAPAPQVNKPAEIPSWVTIPVVDDAYSIYGIAIGTDRENAIKVALDDMVSKLGTTIESSYESNKEVQGSYYKSTIKNKIKSEIAKIEINNYEVIKSQRISYREFAVMIKTDKQKFAKGLIELLDTKKKTIMLKLEAIQNKDVLTKYNVKKELSNEAKLLVSNVLIIDELNSSASTGATFKKEEYLDFISSIEKEFIKEQKNLTFYITGDKKSANFINDIKNFLANQGYNIVQEKKNDSVEVQLDTSDNINTSDSISIAVLKLNIEVFNNAQRIGGKVLILKERFTGSISSVYKNASIHFNQDIKSKGINELIGINLN